mgnify:CR=1 FL=1
MPEKVYRFKLPDDQVEDQPYQDPAVPKDIETGSKREQRLAIHPDETMFLFEFTNVIDWAGFLTQLHMRWPDFLIAYVQREVGVDGGSGSDRTFGSYKAAMLDEGEGEHDLPYQLGRVIFVVKRVKEQDFKRVFTEPLVSLGLDLIPEWTSYVTDQIDQDIGVNITKGQMAPFSPRGGTDQNETSK